MIGPYRVISKLGAGASGKVYLAEHSAINTFVAIKKVIRSSIQNPETFEREINVLKQCDHENIIHLFEVIESDENVSLVMEYGKNGSLADLGEYGTPVPPHIMASVFLQMVDAVDYLHRELHVIHRDIKAENILLDMNNDAKLADFGFCKPFDCSKPMFQTNCGSPAYAAPELIKRMPYSFEIDIWSLGVLLYFMATGCYPFYDDNIVTLLTEVVECEPAFPASMDPMMKNLLVQMLDKNPETRISLDAIRNDPWVLSVMRKHSNELNENDREIAQVKAMEILKDKGVNAMDVVTKMQLSVWTPEAVMFRIVEREERVKAKRAKIMKSLKGIPVVASSYSHTVKAPVCKCMRQPARSPTNNIAIRRSSSNRTWLKTPQQKLQPQRPPICLPLLKGKAKSIV